MAWMNVLVLGPRAETSGIAALVRTGVPDVVVTEAQAAAATEALAREPGYDCILLVHRPPTTDAFAWLDDGPPTVTVIVMPDAHGAAATKALEAGAADVLGASELTAARIAGTLRMARRIARAEERARRRDEQLRGLTSAALCIHDVLSLDDALSAIVEQARRVLGTRQAIISLVDDADERTAARNRLPGWLGAPLRGPDGSLRGLLQVADKIDGDLTPEDGDLLTRLAEIACVAIENARLHEEARKALRARDDVLAVVSHDLRSPLNVILAGTELLLEDDLAGEASERVAAIRRAGTRMDHLLRDLLDVARLERGQMQIEGASEQVASFVAEACDLLRPLARARRQRIAVDVPADTPRVWVDRSRILQVLQNLIDNAIKFSPEGGTIRIEVDGAGQEVRVAVTDSGPGIPPEMLPHVFDRFWRSRDARSGVGLGLAIAKGFIEAHGGHIEVESVDGRGACFMFTVPVAPRTHPPSIPCPHD